MVLCGCVYSICKLLYIITRQLGVIFADWMTSPSRRGGLGWNHPVVILFSIFVIIALVAYMGFTHIDVKDKYNDKEQLQYIRNV